MTVGNILAVALGGAVGSVARYLVSKYAGDMAGGSFPWGTFAVNVAGCLLIGVLAERLPLGMYRLWCGFFLSPVSVAASPRSARLPMRA